MYSNRQCLTLALVALLITTAFIPGTEAGRWKGGSSRKTGGSGGGGSKSKGGSRTQTQSPSPSRTANPSNVALSYPTYNAQPARPQNPQPSAPKAPSAPAQPAAGWNTNAAAPPAAPPNANVNSRPIGWNVNNNQQQAGGIQKSTATQNNNAPPPYSAPYPQQNPPPYSAQHPNGPPPAYSPHQPQYGGQAAPPAYTPNGHGYPQQPNYNNPAAGGYGAQPNYHPQGGGYGGYPQQPGYGGYGGGHYPQQGFGGGQPVINNYYQQKSGGGMGLTNALLLGVGGLSLYNALKPGETKVIYVNNSTNPEDARQVSTNGTHVLVSDNSTTVATPLAPFPDHCGQYMNMPVPPQQLENVTSSTATPLAPFPEAVSAETTTVASAMDTTTLQENATETTMVAQLATEATTAAAAVAAAAGNGTAPVQPLIPSECLPFVTGQVLPTNYTGPPVAAGFGQAPNPNIQYGNPQWQQNPYNTVPLEGVQQKASGADVVAMSLAAIVVAIVARQVV